MKEKKFKIGDRVSFSHDCINMIGRFIRLSSYAKSKQRTICGVYQDGTYKLDVELITGIGVNGSWLELVKE